MQEDQEYMTVSQGQLWSQVLLTHKPSDSACCEWETDDG